MSAFFDTFSPRFIDALGAALLHSIWQAALVAAVLALALRAFKNASPHVRYILCVGALALMALLPVATGLQVYYSTSLPSYMSSNFPAFDAADPERRYARPDAPDIAVSEGNETREALPAPSDYSRFDTLRTLLAASRPFIVFFWMLGVVFFALRLAGGLFAVSRLKRNSLPIANASLDGLYLTLVGRMEIARPARLRASSEIDQPLLIGWLKPMILLPTSLLTGVHPDHVEAILAHELAHIRRRDYLVSLLQSVMEMLFFYHPAVWWISRLIRVEREYCCDDLALSALDNDATYVKALASLETKRVAGPILATGAADGRLSDRIRRIVVGAQESHEAKPSWPTLTVLVLCSAGLFAACEKTPLTSADPIDTASEQVVPADLAQMIATEEIEGTVTYLHDLRESGHPDAFPIGQAAYRAASPEKLRKNLVYVFAHFNSLDADRFLISIAKTDISPAVSYSALRTFQLRQKPSDPITRYLYDYQNQFGNLYDYPELRSSQIAAVRQELLDVILDTSLDASVRSEALRVLDLDEAGVDRAVIDEVVARSDDLRLSLTALECLKDKAEAAARMAAFYRPYLEQASRHLIATRIGWLAVPETVPHLLEFISHEEDDFDPVPFSSAGSLHQLVSNLSAADRLAVRPLVEAARSNYSSGDYRSERLQGILDQIDSL